MSHMCENLASLEIVPLEPRAEDYDEKAILDKMYKISKSAPNTDHDIQWVRDTLIRWKCSIKDIDPLSRSRLLDCIHADDESILSQTVQLCEHILNMLESPTVDYDDDASESYEELAHDMQY